MKKLNLILPGGIDKSLKSLFYTLQNWANSIDDIPYDKLLLKTADIPPGKINWPEWYVPFSAFITATVNTNYHVCSDVFVWDPSKWPAGSWYLEATLAIANAGATVSAHLMGTAEVAGSVLTHTGNTDITPKRSGALTMPGAPANLFVEFKTSNASYQASFAGAKLIFVPN